MPNKVLIKRSNVAGKAPAPADLNVGELAVNFQDRKLFSKEPGGTIIELTGSTGSNPQAIVEDPAAGVNQSITPAAPGDVPLSINGATGQTADLLQVDTDKVVIKADGKVGIGTNAPPRELTVRSTRPWIQLQNDTVGDFAQGFEFFNDTTRIGYFGIPPISTAGDPVIMGFTNEHADGQFKLATRGGNFILNKDGGVQVETFAGTGTRMVTADANGQLGTAAIPSGGATGNFLPLTGGTVTGNVDFEKNLTVGKVGAVTSITMLRDNTNWLIANHASGSIGFQTGGNHVRMTINSSGNVAINDLAGTGDRMVVAAATGVLKTAAIPSGSTSPWTQRADGTLSFGSSTTTVLFDYQNAGGHYIDGETTIQWRRHTGNLTQMTLNYANGNLTLRSLAGTGDRMVVANAGGLLSTQAIPTGNRGNVQHSGNLAVNHVPIGANAQDIKTTPVTIDPATGNTAGVADFHSKTIHVDSLKGHGHRMVTVDNNGLIGQAAIPAPNRGSVQHTGNLVTNHVILASNTQDIKSAGKLYSNAAGDRLGIGVTPAQPLHVAGQIIATDDITSFYSDERLKEDFETITSALDKVNLLEAFTYRPNALALQLKAADDQKRRVGVSAQDVQRILPEAVSPAPFDQAEDGTSKSGEDYLTVDYAKLVPLLIAAVQELTAKVEALKNGD